MVRSHHLYGIRENGLGVLVAVNKLVMKQVHRRLISLLVATRCREIEVGQLQHGLQILNG